MKKNIKSKRTLKIVGIVSLALCVVIVFMLFIFSYLINVFGPSQIKDKNEVLLYLGSRFPYGNYEVIGSVQYEYGFGSLNCSAKPYLTRKWKVKDLDTGEIHEVYEDVDLWVDESFNLKGNGDCSRIPMFR